MSAHELWSQLDRMGFIVMEALLSVLWQSAVLFLVVVPLAWALRKRDAAIRHTLWFGALILTPLLPLLTSAVDCIGLPQAGVPLLTTYKPSPQVRPDWEPAPVSFSQFSDVSSNEAVEISPEQLPPPEAVPALSLAPPLVEAAEIKFSIADYPWALALLAYAAGLVVFGCRLVIGHLRVWGWIRVAVPLRDERIWEAFAYARECLGIKNKYLVLGSDRVAAPVAAGVIRTAILIPDSLLEELSEAELRVIALHELAHAKRRDPLMLSLAAFVRCVFFFHPLVWLASRQVSLLTELAADDAVLKVTGEPVGYAKLLTQLAEGLPENSSSSELAAGIVLSKSVFLRRIEAILSERAGQIRRMTRWVLAGTIVAGMAAIAIALTVPLTQKEEVVVDFGGAVGRSGGSGERGAAAVSKKSAPTARQNTVGRSTLIVGDKLRGRVEDGQYTLEMSSDPFLQEEPDGKLGVGMEAGKIALTGGSDPEVDLDPQDDLRVAELVTHTDETAEGRRSIAASGHAVRFERSDDASFVESVEIFASRYGTPRAPDREFRLYVLDEQFRVLADLKYPYSTVERGDMRWYTLRTPSVEVPDVFHVALAFNPHRTMGIYLGLDESVGETHSYTGLPREGFEALDVASDWMLRAHLSSVPAGDREVRRLADWRPPRTIDPFEGAVELKHDDGESDGKQSYGGRGPAIQFRFGELASSGGLGGNPVLKGLRVYGSRYGSGYDPESTSIDVTLSNGESSGSIKVTVPYGLFTYKAAWVDLPFENPVALGDFGAVDSGSLQIAINPHATSTRGIYFHFNERLSTSHSLAGSTERGFEALPEREWMIRAYLVDDTAADDRQEEATSLSEGQSSESQAAPETSRGRFSVILEEDQQPPTTTVVGYVVDESGDPVADAPVLATQNWQKQDTARLHTRTDSEGGFTFENLEPETYYQFSVDDPRFAREWEYERGFKIPVAVKKLPIRIELQKPHSIAGIVVDERERPVAGVTVTMNLEWMGQDIGPLQGHEYHDLRVTMTGPDGEFTFSRLRPGRIGVILEHPDYAHTRVRHLAVGADYHQITIKNGITLRGSVVAEGQPLPDTKVTDSSLSEGQRSYGQSAVTTDGNGAFEIPRLPDLFRYIRFGLPVFTAFGDDGVWESARYRIYQTMTYELPSVEILARRKEEGEGILEFVVPMP